VDELRWHDLQWALRRAPKRVLELMKANPGRLIASGGFIRDCVNGDRVNDIDLFVTDKESAKGFAQQLAGSHANGEPKPFHETENAYTITRGMGLSVQVIHRWAFTDAEALTESFDFTVAKAAFWWDSKGETGSWQSICHQDFYADLAARRLVYVSPVRDEEPGGSMLRVLKFYQRGYRIPLDSLGAVIARLVTQVKFKDGRERSEKRWAHILTGLLREVDPNIDPTHVAHLPSKNEEEEVNEEVS
jgi:hypothetical protein